MYLRIFGLSSAVRMGRFNYRIIKGGVIYDNVTRKGSSNDTKYVRWKCRFFNRNYSKADTSKKHIEIIYQSQSTDPNKEKMQAFQELVDTRDDVNKYLPDDFDPDAELEAARKEK